MTPGPATSVVTPRPLSTSGMSNGTGGTGQDYVTKRGELW